MLVIFPFEEPLYRLAGVPVTFVGHPLVDLVAPAPDRTAFLRAQGLDERRPVLALLPGSRPKEIAYNLPPIAAALRHLHEKRPDVQFLLALAPSIDSAAVEAQLDGLSVRLAAGATHAVLGACTAAVVASGTATVEAALLGAPMVVVYRLSSLTYHLGRHLVRVPNYAMVNLIAGRTLVPELIQSDFTPDRVAHEALMLLDDQARRERIRQGLAEVRQRLGAPGASARAAAEVRELMSRVSRNGKKP
jgi:lipid-A-disaccharide synthase